MKEYIERSLSYAEFVELLDDLLLIGKTTGTNQSESMFGYGKLNRQRMRRLERTVDIRGYLKEQVAHVQQKMLWLIVTEGWCGDAAQNIPVIEKIAAESNNIDTRYVLRDENLELIDRFLTGGSRSIPKLIALDAVTLELIGTWGARPAAAQTLYNELKHRGVEKQLIMENLQRWYNADKNQSIQDEFSELIELWAGRMGFAESVSANDWPALAA